jgi:hypothetical protein
MTKKFLWALFLVTVALSAWGLFIEQAMAGEPTYQSSGTEEVLPPQAGWGNKALGVAARPVPQKGEYQGIQTEESPSYETPSYDTNNSSDDD